VIRDVPAVEADLGPRQQLTLDARREIEILLKSALLARCEVIETELRERIGQQPVWLDRIVARGAQTERAGVHAAESGVNGLEQTRHFVGVDGRHGHGFELAAPLEKLIAKEWNRRRFHDRNSYACSAVSRRSAPS